MGTFSRSWQLVMQSFAILRSDKQLMLFPVLSAVSCFVVTAMMATGGAFLLRPATAAAIAAGERFHPNQSPMFLLGMFTLYVVNYFVIVFFNVALVGVANSRLERGGARAPFVTYSPLSRMLKISILLYFAPPGHPHSRRATLPFPAYTIP